MSADRCAAPKSSKVCVWVSRYAPTLAQLWDLREYQIIRLGSETTIWRSYRDVWGSILCACGNRPDLVVAVLPDKLLGELAEYADPTPVVYAPGSYEHATDQFDWSGEWQRVVGLKIEAREWSP